MPSLAASKITRGIVPVPIEQPGMAMRAPPRSRRRAGSPPSARAASTQASPSPSSPAARSEAQREISSAIAATASTPPASEIAHEAVRVEVVAEQHALALLAGREEPRAAVVDEVGLVDRLEAEREPRSGASGEKTALAARRSVARRRSAAAQSGLSDVRPRAAIVGEGYPRRAAVGSRFRARSPRRPGTATADEPARDAPGERTLVDASISLAVRERREEALVLARRDVDPARRAGGGRARA